MLYRQNLGMVYSLPSQDSAMPKPSWLKWMDLQSYSASECLFYMLRFHYELTLIIDLRIDTL